MEWIRIFSSEQDAERAVAELKARLLIINGQRICLARHHGRYYAVQDACSHNGESLSKGHVNFVGQIVCPWHNYRFDLASGRPCDSSCNELKTYPVKVDGSGLFIGI